MADENTLVTKLRELENNVPKWNELDKAEKNGCLCLGLMCEGCPLKYNDSKGKCKGKDYIYDYISNLSYNDSLTNKIKELDSLIKSTESQEDIAHYNARINSYEKLKRKNLEICSKIIHNVSIHEIDETKIPEPELPKSKEVTPKKKGRVWTEEQKRRAVEARRRTAEAKKLAQLGKLPKESEVEQPDMVIESGPEKIQIVLAIIDKRLQLIDEKVKSVQQSIQSLKDLGLELEYVMPDFGRTQLEVDQRKLIEAVELINRYLEINTDI